MLQENPRKISGKEIPSPIDGVVGGSGNSVNDILGSISFSFDYEGRIFSFSQISSLGKGTYRINFSMKSKKELQTFSVDFSLKDEKIEILKFEKGEQKESLFLGEEILFGKETIQSFILYFTSTKYWEYLRGSAKEGKTNEKNRKILSTGEEFLFLPEKSIFSESGVTIFYRLNNIEYSVIFKYNIDTKNNRYGEKEVFLKVESITIPEKKSPEGASYKFTKELQTVLESLVENPDINPVLKEKINEEM